MPGLRPWEPEEAVGTLWHRLIGRVAGDEVSHPDAKASLDGMRSRMAVLLRGLGGGAEIEILASAGQRTRHRRSLASLIGHAGERSALASFDGERLEVPAEIAAFDNRADNEAAYLWLAAWAALDEPADSPAADVFEADLNRLQSIQRQMARVISAAPGLGPVYARLAGALLSTRRTARLSGAEANVECVVRKLLGAPEELPDEAQALMAHVCQDTRRIPGGPAPKSYTPFKPVLLWPERKKAPDAAAQPAADHAEGGKGEGESAERKRAKRQKADQASRRDPLILHRFETIKTFDEMMNLNRKAEDDDVENARKAAADSDELNLAKADKRPATRLSFDLDLSPQDIDLERLAAGTLLPEWNHRNGTYLADHVRILELEPEAGPVQAPEADPSRLRRIAAIRKQFEALMPRRTMQSGEDEGDDVDSDTAVRYLCDRAAGQDGSPRIFRKLSGQTRDLSVATLMDTSRSTESIVDGRPVIEVARESLLALGHGLGATGDSHAMYGFSSLKRDRVFMSPLKGFDEPMSPVIEARIAAVKPGYYTRLGAAVRFMSGELTRRSSARRLLLVITDGKPNDLDYYEGRYGIEDTRKAVHEARLKGLAVFGIAIDRKAEGYIPHIFGRSGFAIVSHPSRLAEAMPQIFRHLVS